MINLANANGFSIYSSFGSQIIEGSIPQLQGGGSSISFSISQLPQTLRSVYIQITPISGQTSDFWSTLFSNQVGGEPADQFALSGFYSLNSNRNVSYQLNADSFDETNEVFSIRVYESNIDAAFGVAPLVAGTFTIVDDDVIGTAGDDTLTGGAVSEYLHGYAGNDTMSGGNGDDFLYGGTDNDSLSGGGGRDTLDGGTGVDRLEGGAGNDTYLLTEMGDTVVEAAGGGADQVDAAFSYTLGAEVENLFLTGSTAVSGTGNGLANRITGNEVSNSLYGGAGNDRLFGGGGHDTLNGGTGVDRLEGGAGNDTYVLTAAGDTIIEAVGGGSDQVRSAVTITLARNVESLVLTGSSNANGTGNALGNRITGNSGGNSLNGGNGSDTISGSGGNDKLFGSAGADRLQAGAGRDLLVGGAGKDILIGGTDAGADVFDFNARSESAVGASRDIIRNFTSGVDDIDLRDLDARVGTTGVNEAFRWGGMTATRNSVWWDKAGDGVILHADVNGDAKADFELFLASTARLVQGDALL